jgi:hypothetical protein
VITTQINANLSRYRGISYARAGSGEEGYPFTSGAYLPSPIAGELKDSDVEQLRQTLSDADLAEGAAQVIVTSCGPLGPPSCSLALADVLQLPPPRRFFFQGGDPGAAAERLCAFDAARTASAVTPALREILQRADYSGIEVATRLAQCLQVTAVLPELRAARALLVATTSPVDSRVMNLDAAIRDLER